MKNKPKSKKPPVDPPEDELPKTGDTNNAAALGLIAFGVSLVAIGAAVTGRRKKEEDCESAE